MEAIWCLAVGLLGVAFGLYFGRLLTAIIANWEGTAGAVKWTMSVAGFVLGAGAGAIIFQWVRPTSAPFYVLGLAVAMIFTFFRPQIPSRQKLDLGTVAGIVRMSEALRDEIPDIEDRALLILTPLMPPKTIEREGAIKEPELARRLEKATDKLADEPRTSADSQ